MCVWLVHTSWEGNNTKIRNNLWCKIQGIGELVNLLPLSFSLCQEGVCIIKSIYTMRQRKTVTSQWNGSSPLKSAFRSPLLKSTVCWQLTSRCFSIWITLLRSLSTSSLQDVCSVTQTLSLQDWSDSMSSGSGLMTLACITVGWLLHLARRLKSSHSTSLVRCHICFHILKFKKGVFSVSSLKNLQLQHRVGAVID